MKKFFFPILIIILLLGLFIPIPSSFLDYLVILNVILAIVLLFSVLLVDYPTKLTSIPSFLLILTLFRLVTNISTTRQILAGVEPGKIIPLIGELVIQGSVVIGLVIFSILTLVQLIVVSKGAERVAEVSARFTLDALPGKQMSIDADVRAGLIDFTEARFKRLETQVEARFYGALDGAMKFIKGDAIVGILITLINLIGGLICGVVIQKLSLLEALNYYSLMSIGDGVISQIPAILNAIAAGILVTRVVGQEGSSLSLEVTQQIFGNQGVKLLIVIISFLFACLPGIPAVPFILIGFLFVGLLFIAFAKEDRKLPRTDQPTTLTLPNLLTIKVDSVFKGTSAELLATQIQNRFYQQTGIFLPQPVIQFESLQNNFIINIRGLEVANRSFSDLELTSDLQRDQIVEKLQEFCLEPLDDRATKILVALWEKIAPEQVHYLIPDKISMTRITTLLKELIQENILPKNFDLTMQTIAEQIEHQPTNLQLLNLIRLSLKHQISQRFLAEQELFAITLEPQIDQSFFKAVHQGVAFHLKYLEMINTQINDLRSNYPELVLVCSVPIRRFIWQCLQASGLKVQVLAYEEILPEIKIKSLVCIGDERQNLTSLELNNLQLI